MTSDRRRTGIVSRVAGLLALAVYAVLGLAGWYLLLPMFLTVEKTVDVVPWPSTTKDQTLHVVVTDSGNEGVEIVVFPSSRMNPSSWRSVRPLPIDTLEKLESFLRTRQDNHIGIELKGLPVIVAYGERVSQARLGSVLDACRRAGIESLTSEPFVQ